MKDHIMTRTTLAALFAGFVALPAIAADMEMLDTDGDGMLTIQEVQAVYPDVTADSFSEADANADGLLDAAELAAAQDAGLLPA